eukprot:Lithocolla_globosa_v1_NODE_9772_length_670_cov_5.819512.p1 type:complete len:200 gc:universal NODE_9772_length_670_cov_5.819512:613-14(-)
MAQKHNVQLSKSLSYLLRHGAEKKKLTMDAEGYITVSDILKLPEFKKYSLQDIEEVVAENDKKRFTLDMSGAIPKIKANQGHSIAVKNLELELLKEVPIAVHGTHFNAWKDIEKSGGLNKMKRNHIHLASGLFGEEGVTSGMRGSANVFIYVDTAKAIVDGMTFFRSANGVILTEGFNGEIPLRYIEKVVMKDGTKLFP